VLLLVRLLAIVKVDFHLNKIQIKIQVSLKCLKELEKNKYKLSGKENRIYLQL